MAGIETVLFAIPDPTPQALARLAKVAELAKWGTAWQNQPRVPKGQPRGGEWTDEDGVAEPASVVSPKEPAFSQEPKLPIDDGVYRPAADAPNLIPSGGAEDDAEPRSNGPPADFTRLEDVFPDLANKPGASALLAPIDGFFGVSALADEANLEATLAQYQALVAQIKQIDPTFADDQLLPPGGIAGLSWQGRTYLINGLLMQRAAAYYNLVRDVGPLQVETLRFLQGAVDDAYAEAVEAADAARLQPRLSRAEAIGNQVDFLVRQDLKEMFDEYHIPYGPRADVTVNNRDYQTSDDGQTYRIPDARIRDVSFDWTLSLKTISSPQIRGFFSTYSWVGAVIIIRPSQFGGDYTYMIPRPTDAPF